jgi:hypothetical protein
MFGFLKKAGSVVGRTWGHVGGLVKKFGETAAPVVRGFGNFASAHHHTIASGLHGLAMSHGSENLQKMTGLGLALSSAYKGFQNHQRETHSAHQD